MRPSSRWQFIPVFRAYSNGGGFTPVFVNPESPEWVEAVVGWVSGYAKSYVHFCQGGECIVLTSDLTRDQGVGYAKVTAPGMWRNRGPTAF